jgi:hypothetical protein
MLRKSSYTPHERYNGQHRFEHWYRDNTVCFITSRIRDRLSLFHADEAKAIFWDRFEHYTNEAGFVPWVTTLLDNHYHTLGYLRHGEALKEMKRRVHGSVATLVMKRAGVRHVPFWREGWHRDYFDGCIRDVTQARRAYLYTLHQAVRAGIAREWSAYPHTRVRVEMEPAIARAVELGAFLEGVPYARYERDGRGQGQRS